MIHVRIVTALLSLIALLTGSMDVIVGVAGQANIGVGTAASAPLIRFSTARSAFWARCGLGWGQSS